MTKPKPDCPVCTSPDFVRTVGGGTRPMYRYLCGACDHEWQCVPPHKVGAIGVVATIRKPMRMYRCTICLQPKRGHVCTGFVEAQGDETQTVDATLPTL